MRTADSAITGGGASSTARRPGALRGLAVAAALGLAVLGSGALPGGPAGAPAAASGTSAPTADASAGGATALEQAQQVAAGLQNDPVYLEPGAEDAVGSAPLKSVEAKLKKLPYPYFLVVRPTDDYRQDNSTFMTLVSAALNKPGLYIVLTPGNILYDRPVDMEKLPDGDKLTDQIYDQAAVLRSKNATDKPAVAQLSQYVDLLLDPQPRPKEKIGEIFRPQTPSYRPDDGPSVGGIILGVGAAVAIVGALVALAVSTGRRRSAAAKYAVPEKLLEAARNAQRSQFRKELSDSSLDVAQRLEDLKVQDLNPEQSDRVEHGLDAYAMASRIVDDPSSKTVDLAGALVLLRQAERDLFAIESPNLARRTARGPLVLCVVNPLHGEAKQESAFEAPNGRSYKLPTCKQCSVALGKSATPDWLFDGEKPYFTGKTVWAQTLYGAFGGDLVAELQKFGGQKRR